MQGEVSSPCYPTPQKKHTKMSCGVTKKIEQRASPLTHKGFWGSNWAIRGKKQMVRAMFPVILQGESNYSKDVAG